MMEQILNIKFCLKMGKTAAENFQLIKKDLGDSAVSHTQAFLQYASFGTAMQILMTTNSVDDQQTFKHLTWSKQFRNWFNWSNDSSDDVTGTRN